MAANRLVQFDCDIEGHEDYSLNMVCLDNKCTKRGLICSMCQYYSHQNHLHKPLKVFLNEYKSIVAKVAKDCSTLQLGSGSVNTPNPAAAQATLAQNLKKTKATYEQISSKIQAYQIQVQEQLQNIQELARSYYEEQVVVFKKVIGQKYKATSSGPSAQIAEFINQGKQIVESVERSVPTKADEQRNLINILTENITLAGEGNEVAWKNAHLIKAAASRGIPNGGKDSASSAQMHASEKIEDLQVTAEANMMDIFKSIESMCKKIDGFSSDIIGHITAAKAEVAISIDSQHESDDEIFSKGNNQVKAIHQQQQQQQQQQKAQHNGQEDSPTRIKKLQNYLNSHSKKQDQGAAMAMIDENEEDTGTFSKVIEKPANGATNPPVNSNSNSNSNNNNSNAASNPSANNGNNVQRGYAQRLTSLNRSNLNKPAVIQRQGSDLIDLFEDSQQPSQLNDRQQARQLEYFSTIPAAESKGRSSNPPAASVGAGSQAFKVELTNTIKAHKSMCKDVVQISDDRIATCSFDGFVKIWELRSGKLVRELKNHSKRVNSIAYSSKYEMLVSVSDDGLMIAYKELGGDCWEEVLRMKHEGNNKKVHSIAFYDMEDCILSGLEDGEVHQWRINDGINVKTLDSCKEKVICLRVITEKKFVIGAANSSLYIWRVGSGKIVSTKKNVHRDQINDIAFLHHSGENCFVTSGDDRAIKIWSVNDFSILSELTEEHSVSSLCFAPSLNNTLILSIWGEEPLGYVSFWNLNDAKKVASTNQRKDGITKIRFISNSSQLVCALDTGLLEIYSVVKK